MLKLTLTENDIKQLNKARKNPEIPSERITAILLIAEGMTVKQVAKILNLKPPTIREYIKRYKKDSTKGLIRKFSPGRPSVQRDLLKEFLKVCLKISPTEYGWDKATWNSTIINKSFEKKHGFTVSHDTISRAMNDLGYSYKRPQKSPSINAPSKEEKKKVVMEVIDLIRKDLDNGDAEIFTCDESHVNNEPYLIKGYFLKGGESINTYAKNKRVKDIIWSIESKKWKVYLEKR